MDVSEPIEKPQQSTGPRKENRKDTSAVGECFITIPSSYRREFALNEIVNVHTF